VGRVYDGGMDEHVVVDELGGTRGVREDPAHRAGDQKDILRPVGAEPVVNGRLIAKVQLIARGGQQVPTAVAFEPTQHGGAHQTAVTGNEDSCASFHKSAAWLDVDHMRRCVKCQDRYGAASEIRSDRIFL
jgi:hypothetical protein